MCVLIPDKMTRTIVKKNDNGFNFIAEVFDTIFNDDKMVRI